MTTKTTETEPIYKVLVNGRSCHGGDMEWSLPTKTKTGKNKPGKWHTVEGDIEICATGLHFTTDWQKWLKPNCTVYAAEATDIAAHDDDGAKCVARRGRLLSEVEMPEWWTRTQNAIANLTNIAWLKPTKPKQEWRIFYGKDWAAARAAAWDAARDAARAAARAAAWDAAWDAARDAAWAAARAAAWDAARAAAWDAADQIAINVLYADLPIEQKHRDAITARWDVWQRGYGLMAEIDGVLFVYAPESARELEGINVSEGVTAQA